MVTEIMKGVPRQVVYQGMTLMEMIYIRNHTNDKDLKQILDEAIIEIQTPVAEMLNWYLKEPINGTK